jgi:hypothetical protein
LDRAVIARWENRRTSSLLASVPGVDVVNGRNSRAWAAAGRAVGSGKCAMCRDRIADVLDPADAASGARLACYMDGLPGWSFGL